MYMLCRFHPHIYVCIFAGSSVPPSYTCASHSMISTLGHSTTSRSRTPKLHSGATPGAGLTAVIVGTVAFFVCFTYFCSLQRLTHYCTIFKYCLVIKHLGIVLEC